MVEYQVSCSNCNFEKLIKVNDKADVLREAKRVHKEKSPECAEKFAPALMCEEIDRTDDAPNEEKEDKYDGEDSVLDSMPGDYGGSLD